MSNQYNVVKDEKYGYFKISPTPTQEEIEKYYKDEFYSTERPQLNDSQVAVQQKDKDFYTSRWEDMCDSISDILGLNNDFSKTKVFDIGCGWGEALNYFKAKGMDCFGLDPAPEAIEYTKQQGLNTKVASIENIDVFEGEKFDVVTLINVLEHLADPIIILKTIKDKVLAPGGVIIVDVPNEYNDFQLVGKEIHDLDEWWIAPPAHLNYFSNTSLCKMMEDIGFQIKNCESSFPLEMFLLFGDKYVGDSKLGRECHLKRVQFEQNLRNNGKKEKLREFYKSLAKLDLGRQVVVYAQNN